MIPLKLSLENFMCYRGNVPTLNLESFHVACLSGNNGHGKTALLDSITWALWGKSRARTQEELIHQGQRNMRVELEFMAQDQRYKVTRIYGRSNQSSTGKTELNLSVLSGTDYSSLMGNTIRDTEAIIIDLVKMDYETFISTSYLMQGDSNRFTKSKPTERKKILADVLELTYYDQLEILAKTKSRDLKAKINSNKAIIAIRSQDISIKESTLKDIDKSSTSIEKITPKVEIKSLELDKLYEQERETRAQISEIKTLESSIKLSETELATNQEQKTNQEKEVKHLQVILSRSDEITKKQKVLEEIRLESASLARSLLKTRELESKKTQLQHSVELETQNLENQSNSIKNLIDNQLNPAKEQIPYLIDQIKESKAYGKDLDEQSSVIDQRSDQHENISDQIRKLELKNTSLHDQMSETRKSFDLLTESNAICPLCTNPLSTMERDHISNEYKKRGQESRSHFKKNIEVIRELKEEKSAIYKSLNQSKTEFDRNILSNERKLVTHTSRLDECKKTLTELSKFNSALDTLKHTLSNNMHSVKERDEVKRLSEELQELGYNSLRHREVEKEIEDLTPYTELAGSLYTAEENLRHLNNSIATNMATIDKRKCDIEKWHDKLDTITAQVEDPSDLKAKITRCKTELNRLQEQISSHQFTQQKARLDLRRINDLEDEINDMSLAIKEDSKEANLYDELTTAFGKNGIQALMIERAVPQIQETASQLLSRLTDNRLSVKLELHEGRIDRLTGVRSEELYINISDEVGTRSYETFSGGEAFRIDFAIRISLSKILSARSGSPLPILFIDEGFGSQDSSGQEHLIEAIQSIQGEFEKIIVITHMEHMKEQFEETIEVIKTDQGSTFLTV